jgi:SEC-C motif domain protein
MTTTTPCPCGLPRTYSDCCGRLHAGEPARDAAELMRSRYSAYVLKLEEYLLATWHPRTRPTSLSIEDAPGAATRWLGLDVREHRRIDAGHEEVEFVARYRIGGGRAVRMVERSRFEFDERWFYVDGDVAD